LLDLRGAGALPNRSGWEEDFFFLVADLAMRKSIWERCESIATDYATAGIRK
jgi:hypothetical protein